MPFDDAIYIPDRTTEVMQRLKFCFSLVHGFQAITWRSRSEGRTQRSKEPSVLAARVALLEDLLDVLLGILALADLLEGVVGQGALETLELEGVSRGHQVVVVDGLDEGLDLGSLLLSRLGHAAGDLGGVALDAGYEGVSIGVCLVAAVDGLDDDDLW